MSNLSEVIESQLVIHCPQIINRDTSESIVEEVTASLGTLSTVILDFKNTNAKDVRPIIALISSLDKITRPKHRTLAAAFAPREVVNEIRVGGLDSLIKILPNGIPGQVVAKKQTFNVEFINPFVDSTIKTLATQCSISAEVADKPFLKGSRGLPAVDIAGKIGLISTDFTGAISICFPKATFLAVMQGMLGEPFTEITKDLEDGAAELMNIIFGLSKMVLNEKGHGIDKALPSVVTGDELNLSQKSTAPILVLLFSSKAGPFYIEITL